MGAVAGSLGRGAWCRRFGRHLLVVGVWVMWRSPVEEKLERRLSSRRRRQRREAERFNRFRPVPQWQRRYPPLRWDETGNKRALFGETVENVAGAVWSSVWRRGS